MNNIIDKIYCINLKKRADRRYESEEEFKKHNLKVEFIEAVDGHSEYKKEGNPIRMINCHPAAEAGLYGCTMSHKIALEKIVKNGFKNALILEDDVAFCDGINSKLETVFSHTPIDYDILMLGLNIRSTPIVINNYIGKVSSAYCTHAYIITNEYSNYVIELLEKMHPSLEPIDSFLFSNIAGENNTYASRECLAWQRESFSDTENRHCYHGSIRRNF